MLTIGDLTVHPSGLVVHMRRSKSNQTGLSDELVVLPRTADLLLCPVTAIARWRAHAGIDGGVLLRSVSRHNHVGGSLSGTAVNAIVQRAVARAGLDPLPYSAHSLRAGFVTFAHLRGASDRAIAHQTRHRSLATLGRYVRIDDAWTDNAATQLGV